MWKIIESNKRKSRIIKFFMFIVFLLTGAFYGLLVAASLVLLAIYISEGDFQITINGFAYLLLGSAVASTITIFMIYLSKISKREKLILDDLDVVPYSRMLKQFEKNPQSKAKQLYNITTEMAIASGLGYTPDIYIMNNSVPNAFAVGYSKDSAKIVLTSSLIEILNRDELQGVIAHEISHIVNYDCKLMTDAYTMLYFVYFLSGRSIAQSGSEMFESSSSSYRVPRIRMSSSGGGKNNSAGIIAIIALVVILVSLIYIYVLAPLLVAVLYSMLSKTREYLADACAVQFTRYPSGLMNALIKITHPQAPSFSGSSMAMVNALAIVPTFATGKISTHPPVEQRIKILSKMAGSGLADYNQVFARIMHKPLCSNSRSFASQAIVLPSSNETNIAVMQALAASGAAESNVVPINDEIKLPENVASSSLELQNSDFNQELSALEKHRMVGEIFEASAGYTVIECRCNTKLKIPPIYDNVVIECPHCLRKYELNNKAAKLIPAVLEGSDEMS